MLKLHHDFVCSKKMEAVTCNTLYVFSPYPYSALLQIVDKFEVTGVVLVDPLIHNPEICKWTHEYESRMLSDIPDLPIFQYTKAPKEIEYIQIV